MSNWNPEIGKKMDEGAEDAKKALDKMLKAMSETERTAALDVCQWMKDNYMAGGYKRLSKVMIAKVS